MYRRIDRLRETQKDRKIDRYMYAYIYISPRERLTSILHVTRRQRPGSEAAASTTRLLHRRPNPVNRNG